MAISNGMADQGWYLDSGATHHLTNASQNLNDGKIYLGSNSLLVSNGRGLKITHWLYLFQNLIWHLFAPQVSHLQHHLHQLYHQYLVLIHYLNKLFLLPNYLSDQLHNILHHLHPSYLINHLSQ